MALYRVHYVDHGNSIYWTRHLDLEDDAAAIAAVRRVNAPQHRRWL